MTYQLIRFQLWLPRETARRAPCRRQGFHWGSSGRWYWGVFHWDQTDLSREIDEVTSGADFTGG